MSNALAIAGVTHVLRGLLNDGLSAQHVSGTLGSQVGVSVLAPDRVVANGGNEVSQLNLFLHQVTPNAGWRNEALPSRDTDGRTRLTNPPLALDLHYLLSAYSGGDLHAEILLGYGMQLLHENPLLTRGRLRDGLQSPPNGNALQKALEGSGLENQIEQIKITPELLNTEELSKLWTATQTHMRPTAAYCATVVLIQSEEPVRSPLPVLSRGPVDPATGRDRGVVVVPGIEPPYPTILTAKTSNGQAVVQLEVDVDLDGHHLDGDDRAVVLTNDRFEIAASIDAQASGGAGRMTFRIPNARSADFPAGDYRVAARVTRLDEPRPGESRVRVSNPLPLTIAPSVTLPAAPVARDPNGVATFTVGIRPTLRQGQSVVLVLGQSEFAPEPFADGDATLSFVVENAPVGDHLARVRVDGIESPIIDRLATPPAFLNQRVTIQ